MVWRDYLPADVYERLAECRSVKSDVPILVNARWKYMRDTGKDKQGFTKEDAVADVLDLLDSNSQWKLADLNRDEYTDLCR